MNPTIAALPLASVDEYIPFFGMMIPIALFFFILLIIVVSQYFKSQSRKMWHETARIALEKGQPVPIAPTVLSPAIEAALGKKLEDRPSSRGDLKAGLILLAVSAGLYVSRNELGSNAGPHIFIFGGGIVGFVGVALLLNALITYLTTKKKSENTSSEQPPKA
jgi:hypothetical protein